MRSGELQRQALGPSSGQAVICGHHGRPIIGRSSADRRLLLGRRLHGQGHTVQQRVVHRPQFLVLGRHFAELLDQQSRGKLVGDSHQIVIQIIIIGHCRTNTFPTDLSLLLSYADLIHSLTPISLSCLSITFHLSVAIPLPW